MSGEQSLEQWNFATLCLVQACLGSVSKNFRMVVLGRKKNKWNIIFYIKEEKNNDLEEIEEIRVDFLALSEGSTGASVEVHIGDGDLPMPVFPARAIFMEKDQILT